ncbi:MAG: hypothetical protein EAZ89_10620 [Bacteroidetes bacterium]|nr:MAG: hypothetical protein EAZ89_10620 [Bacteroidota bacterium]
MINRTRLNQARNTGEKKAGAFAGVAAAAGKGLSARKVDEYLRFSAFLVLIGMVYIWNSYQAEQQVKEFERYKREVKTLKSHYMLKEATLSAGTRYSEIEAIADSLGLSLSSEPAYQLVKGQTVPQSRLDKVEILPGLRFETIAPADTQPSADTLPPADTLRYITSTPVVTPTKP